MSESPNLFSPMTIGAMELPNRIALAPMTRSRAMVDNIPAASTPLYYSQRADAGLLISEATQISPQGIGYMNTPGIYTPEQIEAWRAVTDAVHANGGRIYLQLWHVGRVSHPYFHGGELPVAPSAINPNGRAYLPSGFEPTVTPRALELSEIPGIIEDYHQGAKNALAAGFDGVELHGANGYLPDQFLQDVSNHRTDEYGGSIENRSRFLLEITERLIEVWGRERVGVRLSPWGKNSGMGDSNPVALFTYVAKELGRLGVGYIHILENAPGHPLAPATSILPAVRDVFHGAVIVNSGYDRASGDEVIRSGNADMVSFGVPFLANPDLVERLRRNAPLNAPDMSTFFAGGDKGYIDYPTLEEIETAA